MDDCGGVVDTGGVRGSCCVRDTIVDVEGVEGCVGDFGTGVEGSGGAGDAIVETGGVRSGVGDFSGVRDSGGVGGGV